MKPSPGRIVMYNHPGDRTGKYPPKQSPAMVLYVHDAETVDLRVFTAPTWESVEVWPPTGERGGRQFTSVCVGAGGEYTNLRVEQGDGPLQWNWPEQIEG